ncbi:DUF402 domain-containing protein [Luteipulveratus flavus]|uniref:DUF402 domain-containing protein n=1 Tax=Luteipulveratus flavus TaxID=3031728 RepID=A0ABT6C3X9_9MICO|nr:DUF402 domain-containing protein [Luteipulveratus sp. YIM 133296]MDF8263263.1 DUF402 domain-containing protein [Luteipulveratus sp. YIM 133296]
MPTQPPPTTDPLAPDDVPDLPGARVHVDFRKWGDGEHWQFEATYLGADEFGHWLGLPAGTAFARPGAAFEARRAQVVLFPLASGYAATFWDCLEDEPHRVLIYVDIATTPVWRRDDAGWSVTAVDLDLDVIRLVDGTVYVDDEDEFAEHQVSLAYPAEVVAGAERDCAWVLESVRSETGPFGGTGFEWLRRYLASSDSVEA